MKFIVHWTIKPKHRDEAYNRFKHHGHELPKEIKLLGSWHNVNQLAGWAIIETSDVLAIGTWLHAWTDLNSHEVIPVVDDEGMRKILAS